MPTDKESRGLLGRARASLQYRLKWAKLGVLYFRKLKLSAVRIGGRRIPLSFPAEEVDVQSYEFGRIVFDDCYRLSDAKHPVATVMDVGANIGLFALAARYHFPHAAIHCYEPNPDILEHLARHCTATGSHVHPVALGRTKGRVALSAGEDSLHSIAVPSAAGIPMESFADEVARLGSVDLLKLDCEGAEWDLFTCTESWPHIRALAMEYHLWAKPHSTVESVRSELFRIGFTRVHIEPQGAKPFGFAWASK